MPALLVGNVGAAYTLGLLGGPAEPVVENRFAGVKQTWAILGDRLPSRPTEADGLTGNETLTGTDVP